MDNSGNKTIENALSLLDAVNESGDITDLSTREVGLQLVLLGLAEVHSKRAHQLSGLVCELEKEVFSHRTLAGLEPRQLIDLYKMSVNTLDGTSDYVRNTWKAIDWKTLQASVIAVQTKANKLAQDTGDTGLSDMADKLLKELATHGDLYDDKNKEN